MVKKEYNWQGGAQLGEHSKIKHRILKDYIREYLLTRCQRPVQERFRLAIVDGFSGGGRYDCGSVGSPLLFIETLRDTHRELSISRKIRVFVS